MIIILSYYSDGSSKLELAFFPNSENQAGDVAVYLSGNVKYQTIEIYKIHNLEDMPKWLYPKQDIISM